ncbi:MATE family efflux transporter [Myxococcota bacterium]|nr:MATE family efflux transporter [Myxococcota bacterium]MBU1380814.1 MATE family efflux transporter [Myxococcota bacterium]MBU1498948.1 MATE family efflux transporter [Myxococcota bacterium]
MKKLNPLESSENSLFLKYSSLSVIGMIAISSAGIVDAMFLGKFVGESALAAVNFTMPVFGLIVGITLMFSVGSSVSAGSLLGEGRVEKAAGIFSRSGLFLLILSIMFTLLIIPTADLLSRFLGGDAQSGPPLRTYLIYLIMFAPAFVMAIFFMYFVRLDGYPGLATMAMISSSIANIVLDWVFIVRLGWGVKGAAVATGLSYFIADIFYLWHFLFRTTRFKFSLKKGSIKDVRFAAFNGFSEFANEISAGLITFMFNWTLMKRMGTSGVAAYTIVNYLLWLGLMICYGISDSLQPLISTNHGAGKYVRISNFLRLGFLATVIFGSILSLLLLMFPERMVGLFVSGNTVTSEISINFIKYFWPAFILSGINIIFSVYFTAILRAGRSAIISVLHGLVFPAILLIILPNIIGDPGIFLAVPISELITLFFAIGLFISVRPKKLSEA